MRPPIAPSVVMPLPRRRTAWALGIALALHLALAAFLGSNAGRAWVRSLAPGVLTLPQRGGGGDGGGGRERVMAYISLPAAPAPRPVAPLKRSPAVSRPEPAVPALPPVVSPAADSLRAAPPVPVATAEGEAAGAGGGAGPGAGGGEGGGTGGGVGPGAGPGTGGEGGRETAPEPRQLVLPPADYPKDMRGRRVEVTFYVAADGRVDRIAVVPAIPDGGFARKFEEAMRNYRFRPARSPEGTPVPGTTTVTVFF